MIEIVYRYDPEHPPTRTQPGSADEARRRLELGNLSFASLLDPQSGHAADGSWVIPFDLEDIGIAAPGAAPKQQPYAAVLGCSDARVPTELIFNAACNEMFVVRIAGNVLGREGIGSLDYAVENLRGSLKLLVVLGHSHCGAVTAAADAFLKPASYLGVANNHPLRSIVNSLYPAVRSAADVLMRGWGRDVEAHPGYRSALIETAIVLNAALTASMLVQEMGPAELGGIKVVYGVYDLVSRRVQTPSRVLPSATMPASLVEPPVDAAGFDRLGEQIVQSTLIESLLAAKL
jgi:carbonic anhydrase